MRGWSGRRGLTPLFATAVVAALLVARRARADGPSSQVVAVLAPHESRLADEIRRELESSKFEVLSADLGGRPWQDIARRVDEGRLVRGVAVEPNDRTLTVYTRRTGADTVDIRLVLSVDPADRMARRHACLSVVEFLHALTEADPAALSDAGRTPAPVAPENPGGRTSGRGAAPPPPSTAAPQGAATSAAAPGLPAPLPMTTPRVSWQLGVGTTFDLETGAGEPTSHLQFLTRFPLSPHVYLTGRVLWPLLAAQYRSSGSDVRAWTFAGGASLQYAFGASHRLRPFLGISLGSRLGLAETTPLAASQSGQSFTVSGTFGIETGIRYTIGPRLEVFFQIEAARNWQLPPPDAGDRGGDAAANGESARAAIGVTFDS